jgi:hypothetical protein
LDKAGLSQSHNLSMRTWIIVTNGPILPDADDLATGRNNSAYRNLTCGRGCFGFAQRRLHELRIR